MSYDAIKIARDILTSEMQDISKAQIQDYLWGIFDDPALSQEQRDTLVGQIYTQIHSAVITVAFPGEAADQPEAELREALRRVEKVADDLDALAAPRLREPVENGVSAGERWEAEVWAHVALDIRYAIGGVQASEDASEALPLPQGGCA